MYEVTVKMPNLGEGVEVELDGLGIFKNGVPSIIDDEAAESYKLHTATIVENTDKKGNVIRSFELGPNLEKAFANNKTIVVLLKNTQPQLPGGDE